MSYPHATGTHAQMNIRRHLAEISYPRAQLAAIVGQSIVYGTFMRHLNCVYAIDSLVTRHERCTVCDCHVSPLVSCVPSVQGLLSLLSV